jgi:hypothetical protein
MHNTTYIIPDTDNGKVRNRAASIQCFILFILINCYFFQFYLLNSGNTSNTVPYFVQPY